MKDEVNFLPVGKRDRFLQIDTIMLGVWGQAYPNYQKVISLQFFCNILRKVNDEVDFLHTDKHESLLQIDTMILMGMAKHF